MAEWREVPGFPLYEVSSEGEVRNRMTGRLLRQRCGNHGYRVVDLHVGVRAGFAAQPKQTTKTVHRLVCLAFQGEAPFPRADVAHNDGVRSNNRAENLRWATCAENHADKKLHGTNNHGAVNGRAKLTEEQALEVLRLARAGQISHDKIATQFGVSQSQVSRIARGKKWAHLQTLAVPPGRPDAAP